MMCISEQDMLWFIALCIGVGGFLGSLITSIVFNPEKQEPRP